MFMHVFSVNKSTQLNNILKFSLFNSIESTTNTSIQKEYLHLIVHLIRGKLKLYCALISRQEFEHEVQALN